MLQVRPAGPPLEGRVRMLICGHGHGGCSGVVGVASARVPGGETVTAYLEWLEAKRQDAGGYGFLPDELPAFLFGFQRFLTGWSLQQGRSAIFADCGLGKTPMQLVWADEVHKRTGRPVLILTPLAVSFQTEHEAHKFGIEAAVSRDGSVTAAITVTNYDRLHHFDREDFAGVVCDESSAIKSFDGVRRWEVTEFLRKMPYRLLCTATAAPNDYVELGTSSEALGYLGHMDMLSRFFTNRDKNSNVRGRRYRWSQNGSFGNPEWRFKGHAEQAFWRWVASWSRSMRRPSDLGFSDDGFHLPNLHVSERVVTARAARTDTLFDLPAIGLREERDEARRTIEERCEMVEELLRDANPAVAWCQLNAEGDLLTSLIDGAVQIKGGDHPDQKEETLVAFSNGEIRVLITKPVIGAWGLNWQHCNRMTFFPSHSYEQYYQAVRRSWRFGQTRPVQVDLITTEGGARALANLQRKAAQADRMFESLVAHMRDALAIQRDQDYDVRGEIPAWMT